MQQTQIISKTQIRIRIRGMQYRTEHVQRAIIVQARFARPRGRPRASTDLTTQFRNNPTLTYRPSAFRRNKTPLL